MLTVCVYFLYEFLDRGDWMPGRVGEQQLVKYHTQRPNLRLGSVLAQRQQLWRHVQRGA